jgi:uncharacterized protein YgiM (DUF1202 family)
MRLAAGVLLAGAALAGTAVPAAAAPGRSAPAVVASDICNYQVRGVYDWLNVRSGPGTNYSIIGKLYPNQYVSGDCRQSSGPGASIWVHVKLASGNWGWSSKDYLALMP